jgi:rubredoxin
MHHLFNQSINQSIHPSIHPSKWMDGRYHRRICSLTFNLSLFQENGGLVPGEEKAVKDWLVRMGFQRWDLRTEVEVPDGWIGNTTRSTPMARACSRGQLNVCKWLYDHGGAKDDVNRANRFGETPMMWACQDGHLAVVEWIYEVCDDADVTTRRL